MTSKIPFQWLKHAKTEDEKANIELLVLNSQAMKTHILNILSEYASEIERKGLVEEDYKEAGILAVLAFRNGQLSMLDKIAKLFNFKTTE